MPNGTTPAGLTGAARRTIGGRAALGISDIDAAARQVLDMLSNYVTSVSERRLSGGKKATDVEKAQKSAGDKWGYGTGAVTFLVLSPIIGPAAAAKVAGLSATAARKIAEDQARKKIGVGGISLREDELPLPPKPKYYKAQHAKLPTVRGEAEFDLENLYQMGRQMALPRALGTGYNVYRGANLLTDVYSGIKDMFADKGLTQEMVTEQMLDTPGLIGDPGYGGRAFWDKAALGYLPKGAEFSMPQGDVPGGSLASYLKIPGLSGYEFTDPAGKYVYEGPRGRLDWLREYIKGGPAFAPQQ
jgi:hypothetical protein